ncbi:addiction module antidote protein [Glaciimonas sp. GG7]
MKLTDSAQHLQTQEDVVAYLNACLEKGDPALVTKALADIIYARAMTQLARDTGLEINSLCKALSGEDNPELDTILKVVKALGLKLHACAV